MGWITSYCYNHTPVAVGICIHLEAGTLLEATISPNSYTRLAYGKSKIFTVIVTSFAGQTNHSRQSIDQLSLQLTPKQDCTLKMGGENGYVLLMCNQDVKVCHYVFINEANILSKHEVSALEALIALHDEHVNHGGEMLSTLHRRITEAKAAKHATIRCDNILRSVHCYVDILSHFTDTILNLHMKKTSTATRQLLNHAELHVVENVNNYAASLSHFPANSSNQNRNKHYDLWRRWLAVAAALYRQLVRTEIVLRRVDIGGTRQCLTYRIDSAGRGFLGGLQEDQVVIDVQRLSSCKDILWHLQYTFGDGQKHLTR